VIGTVIKVKKLLNLERQNLNIFATNAAQPRLRERMDLFHHWLQYHHRRRHVTNRATQTIQSPLFIMQSNLVSLPLVSSPTSPLAKRSLGTDFPQVLGASFRYLATSPLANTVFRIGPTEAS
jgi:hypothetical protein